MNDQTPQDRADRQLWRRWAAPSEAGPCPDEMALAAYLDGSAPADEAERVEAHLAGCDACRHAVAELRSLLAGGPVLATPQVVTRAKSLLPAPTALAAKLGRRRTWRRVARWAATAAAAVLVSYGGFQAGSATRIGRNTEQAALVSEMTFGLEEAPGQEDLYDNELMMLMEDEQ